MLPISLRVYPHLYSFHPQPALQPLESEWAEMGRAERVGSTGELLANTSIWAKRLVTLEEVLKRPGAAWADYCRIGIASDDHRFVSALYR